MMRKNRGKTEWTDDGRTIVPMDAEGMPHPRHLRENAKKLTAEQTQAGEPLSARETRQLMLAGMKWALLLSVGFVLVLVLFVLFCVKIWLA